MSEKMSINNDTQYLVNLSSAIHKILCYTVNGGIVLIDECSIIIFHEV